MCVGLGRGRRQVEASCSPCTKGTVATPNPLHRDESHADTQGGPDPDIAYVRPMSTVVIPDGLTTITRRMRLRLSSQVTLNRRLEMHNAFNERMQDELAALWRHIRLDDAVRVVVLTGAGDRAFCTGIDRGDIPVDEEFDPFTYDDPGQKIGPKSQGLWKPVIAAVNGMACGGGFYLLGESDIIIACRACHVLFDPHVSFTMTVVYEPILLTNRMAFGDLVRMSLVGLRERMSARTARETGLVSDVVSGRAAPRVQAERSPMSSLRNRRRACRQRCERCGAVRGLSFEATSSRPGKCLPSARHECPGAPGRPSTFLATEAGGVETALKDCAVVAGPRCSPRSRCGQLYETRAEILFEDLSHCVPGERIDESELLGTFLDGETL